MMGGFTRSQLVGNLNCWFSHAAALINLTMVIFPMREMCVWEMFPFSRHMGLEGDSSLILATIQENCLWGFPNKSDTNQPVQ